jgi:hypothetical protein
VSGSRLPLSVVFVDLACVAFAAWTVLCNAVVLLGGNSVQLGITAALLLAALGLALFVSRRRGWLRDGLALFRDDEAEARVREDRERQPWPLVRIVLLLLGGLIALRFAKHHDLFELSALALAFFALSYVAVAGSDRHAAPGAGGWRSEATLWAIALGCGALTLCTHKSNSDDSFYVNIAVSVADFPHTALLSKDTLLGHGEPFKIIAYKAPSIELLGGFISYLTGIPALSVCHMLLAAVAGLLAPLALARLLRLLDEERWLFALIATLLYLLYDGGARGSYGNFAFVRLFQGKAMLLTTAAPLLMAHGLRFGLAPSKKTFFMLAVSQIAALGTSVTAFWAAPLFAMVAVLAAVAPRLSSLWTLLVAPLSAAYGLGLGVYFTVLQGGPSDAQEGSLLTPSASEDAAYLIKHAYAMVLGSKEPLYAAVAIALIAWPLCRTPLARRFAVVFPLGFFLFIGNPWLARHVAIITTSTIHWRVLWLLPIPILAGLIASSVLQPNRRWQQWFRVPLFVALLLFYRAEVAPRSTLARAWLAWPPHPKVDLTSYLVAQALTRAVPPHQDVLATVPVSRVLPMLNGYSYPLFIKPSYLPAEVDDRKWRQRLTRAVTNPRAHGPPVRFLLDGFERYHLRGVAMQKERDPKGPATEALTLAKFHKLAELRGHEIWVR